MEIGGIGYEAIEKHLGEIFPAATDQELLTEVGEPLVAIKVLSVGSDWLLVTLGLTQLDGEPLDPKVSGWGQEITLRVARENHVPPPWASRTLVELAGRVVESRFRWEDGDTVDLESPEGGVAGVLFLSDPDLHDQTSELGRFGFIRAVGITENELDLDDEDLAQAVRERNPVLITDPGHSDPEVPHPSEIFENPTPDASEVARIWVEIEESLHTTKQGLAARLRQPVSEEDLADAERRLGRELPEDVRASYLRHDGESCDPSFTGLFGDSWFKPLNELLDAWQSENQLKRLKEPVTVEGPMQAQLWNPAWIPIAGDSGYFYCIDLDPAPGGNVGQVIYLWRAPQRRVIARSITEFLQNQLKSIRSGVLYYDEDNDRLVERHEPTSSGLELDI